MGSRGRRTQPDVADNRLHDLRAVKHDQQRGERCIRAPDRLRPGEPCDVGALTGRRARVTVGTEQEADVEVLMTPGRQVNVDMHRTGGDRHRQQTGLLHRLPRSRGEQVLAGVDVTTRLDPDAESLVQVQQDAAWTDDDGRRGQMHGVGVLVEGTRQPVELGSDSQQRQRLALVDRLVLVELTAQQRDALVEVGQIASASYGGVSPGWRGTSPGRPTGVATPAASPSSSSSIDCIIRRGCSDARSRSAISGPSSALRSAVALRAIVRSCRSMRAASAAALGRRSGPSTTSPMIARTISSLHPIWLNISLRPQSLGAEPSVTTAVFRAPSRRYVNFSRCPGTCRRIATMSSSADITRTPSTSTMTSPACKPARCAGPPGVTPGLAEVLPTIFPPWPVYAGSSRTPMIACVENPWLMICCAIRFAWSMGMAKPSPIEPPCPPPIAPADKVAIAELTPITAPAPSTSGPPELPGLIAASVWIASITSSVDVPSTLPASTGRSRALTMPEVTVPASPSGEPTAMTGSPTTTALELPSTAGCSPRTPRTRTTARSLTRSRPTISPRTECLSWNTTLSLPPSRAGWTTWLLVRM